MSDLGRIEAFFQSYIVDPRDDETVGQSARREAAKLICPSPSLNPVERLNVYRDQYLARMEEALSADYPALRHFLGEHGFWDLVTRYVETWPSRSWNLSRLSDHLPEYLEDATWLRRPGFARDMARLEQALCVVFEARP
ncbi:MAG: HvfC/BufC family peptide modification chaperone, partial [Candidatus Xenobia bacterium]